MFNSLSCCLLAYFGFLKFLLALPDFTIILWFFPGLQYFRAPDPVLLNRLATAFTVFLFPLFLLNMTTSRDHILNGNPRSPVLEGISGHCLVYGSVFNVEYNFLHGFHSLVDLDNTTGAANRTRLRDNITILLNPRVATPYMSHTHFCARSKMSVENKFVESECVPAVIDEPPTAKVEVITSYTY